MALSIADTALLRDRLYPLDPDQHSPHRVFYEQTRLFYITASEGACPLSYDDGKGYITVGIGFNMDLPDARLAWQHVFQGSVSFDAVYQKQRTLTEGEMQALLTYDLAHRENQLQKIYKSIWTFLHPNERLAIESAYYNAPRTVNGDTRFWQHLHVYVEKKELEGLKQAVFELKERSNPEPPHVRQGIQNRRDSEAEMLSSFKLATF